MTESHPASPSKVDYVVKPQFYRRQLPDSCIPFSSDDGKKIFREAMVSGHMECYFRLAAQFRTQDEPAFCGLSTLVMVLNALDIDPERIWKGPWRWYHENMLDCCVPVKFIEQEGITFGQFVCLAQCNGLETSVTSVDERASLIDFRDTIERYTKQDETIITLSYSRKVLSQTGDGHFSPIGGYHPDKDLVLILDTARFKYPPHWVPVPLLFEAMKSLDKMTGKPRGYVLMHRHPKFQPLVLFRISETFEVTKRHGCLEAMEKALDNWKQWLTNTDQEVSNDNIVKRAILFLENEFSHLPKDHYIFTTQIDPQYCKDDSKVHCCTIKSLIEELEKTKTFVNVTNVLSSTKFSGETHFLCGPRELRVDRMKCRLDIQSSHCASMFLLSWPYQVSANYSNATNACRLNTMVADTLQSGNFSYLGNEIRLLRKLFSSLLSQHGQCCK